MAYFKPLVLVTTPTGCIVPTSHKLNPDGYFRKRVTTLDGAKAVLVMYHRYVWELDHGPIPDGYEVDHVCKNRACCNVNHLRLLHGDEHAVVSNQDRYAARIAEAKAIIKANPKITGVALGERFGVSWSCACRWKREVQAECLMPT